MSNESEQDTDLAPTQHAPEEVQAWSLHETDEIQSAWHGRIVSAALITLLCAVVAAVAWFAGTLFGGSSTKPSNPQAIPTTAATKPVAAPPPRSGSSDSGDKQSASNSPVTGGPTVELVASGFGQKGNYVEGIAIVTNNSEASIGQFVTASANFLDQAGRIVATAKQVERFSWFKQQLVLPIWLGLPNTPETKVASIDVSVSISDYPNSVAQARPELPILKSDEIGADPYGGFTAAFTFTNNTPKDLKDLRVGVVCYDAAGTIIGGASEYPSLVAAAKPIRIDAKLTVSSKPTVCKAFPNHGL